MQILSWAHKRFINDAIPGKKLRACAAGENERDTHVESGQKLSHLKNRRHDHHLEGKRDSATGSKRVANVWSRPTLQQYFQDDDLHQSESTLIESAQTRPWLLNMGSLSAGEMVGKKEMDSTRASPDIEELSLIDSLEIRDELQKILYTTDRQPQPFQDAYAACYTNFEQKSNKGRDAEGAETAERQMFPLQTFLDVPLKMAKSSDVAKKKQKHVVVHALSRLFNSAVISHGFLHQKAKETVKRVKISPFLLEKLAKIHPTDSECPPRYRRRVNKLLQFLRKKGAVSSKGDLPTDFEENNNCVKASKCRGNMTGADGEKLPGRHHLAHRLETIENGVCLSSSLSHQCSWHLDLEDVHVFKTGNEYWIKTDDEYLVLEL